VRVAPHAHTSRCNGPTDAPLGYCGCGTNSVCACVCSARLLIYHIVKLLTALTMEPSKLWSQHDTLRMSVIALPSTRTTARARVPTLLANAPRPHAPDDRHCVQYKAAILHHKVVPVFMDLLVVPLSMVGTARQDQDTGIIELVLCLLRNLLQVALHDGVVADVCGIG
jgi:hypothetical protein